MPLPGDARWAHAVSSMLGRPLLPHQLRDLAAPVSETNLAGTGYAHTSVCVLMPRQVGKTSTLFALLLARMMHQSGYAAAYTAQTGHTVTERFGDPGAWLDQVEQSPLAARHRTRRSQGTERVTNTRTASFVKAFPPRPGKLRSNALDCVVLDECQEHDWVLGRILEADVGPVFTTRPRRQLIMAGTAAGPGWWKSKVDAARAGAGLLVEVGTWPADADPTDPATWHAHHPGLMHGLTDVGHLHDELARLGPQSFAREYGNRWDDDATGDAPVPIPAWDACLATVPGQAAAVAFDVTPDRVTASIVGVTSTSSVRLLWSGPARDLPQRLDELAGDLAVHALPGQAGTAADLRAAGRTVHLLTADTYRRACQQFHDAVVRGDVHHDHQPELRESFAVADRAWHGDAWVLSARRSAGDITAAAAAVVAWHVTSRADALIA